MRRKKVTVLVEATLTSNGCVISGEDVKAALGVGPKTGLKWHIQPQGDVFVRAKDLSILSLAGAVKARGHVAIEDMCP